MEEERYTTHIFGTTYFRQLPQRPQNTTSLELCYCCQTHSPRHEAIGNYRENLIVRTFRYVCIFIQKLFWRTYFFMMTFWSSNLYVVIIWWSRTKYILPVSILIPNSIHTCILCSIWGCNNENSKRWIQRNIFFIYVYETIVLHTTRFVFLQKNVVSICRTKWLK